MSDPAQREALSRGQKRMQTYPVFVESGGGLVSQAEHTVLVLPEGAGVMTR